MKIIDYFYFYLRVDYKSQQKISKSANRVLQKDVESIKAVRDEFIFYTKCEKKILKKSGMVAHQPLKERCCIPDVKINAIYNILSQVISQN